MNGLDILPATDAEKDWSAKQMSQTDPWIRLGITLEQCSKTCHDPEYRLYVARLDGQPCGTILLDPRGVAGSPYIKTIVVDPAYRGKGIGTSLLTFAEDLFRGKNKHLFLCVSSFNNRARKLYEQAGFKVVGEFEDYIIEGESELIMHKRLR